MSKVCTMAEAIRTHVRPGQSVYITGFTHLIGFAAAHEIIRQGIRDLTLVRLTPDVVYDQLVAAGCARHLVFSYLGNPGVSSLHAIRRAIESGAIEWTEYTHGALLAALHAGASRMPFVPVDAMRTTDLARHNPHVRMVRSPYTGRDVAVLPPVRPDVAIVHAQRADRHGNVQVWGAVGEIAEAALAARAVVVTAEELVDEAEVRNDPNRTLLPGLAVDAVVHEPWGAHPSYVQGRYARDNRFYRRWAGLSAEPADLRRYLDDWVIGLPDRRAYTERLGDRVDVLSAVGDGWSRPVNYGQNAALAAAQER